MPRLQDVGSNTDNPVHGGVWVYDAPTDTFKNMVVVGVNLTGIADGSLLSVGGGGTQIQYVTPVPVLLSEAGTAVGRSLVGSGDTLVDDEVLTILLRDAAPQPGDGFEGAYWLNRSTGSLHGPRGQDSAGLWPADTKSFLSTEGGVSQIDEHLRIVGTEVKHQSWPTVFKFTNFAVDQGDVDDETNGYVGLEVFIGSEALGWAGMRPYGSNAGQVKHLRMGGHQTGGELQDFSGSPYITKAALDADRQGLPMFAGNNDPGLAITAGTLAVYGIDMDAGDQEITGSITPTAVGVQIDEAGQYDHYVEVTIHNPDATKAAILTTHLRVDGVNLTGIGTSEFIKIAPDSTYMSRLWFTRRDMAVGEVISSTYELVDNASYSASAGSWGVTHGGILTKRVG